MNSAPFAVRTVTEADETPHVSLCIYSCPHDLRVQEPLPGLKLNLSASKKRRYVNVDVTGAGTLKTWVSISPGRDPEF